MNQNIGEVFARLAEISFEKIPEGLFEFENPILKGSIKLTASEAKKATQKKKKGGCC